MNLKDVISSLNNYAPLITAVIIIFQIYFSFKKAIQIQKDKIKEEFNLKFFNLIQEKINDFNELDIENYIRVHVINFINQLKDNKLPNNIVMTKARFPDFLTKHNEFTDALNVIINIIETHEVINPNFKVFRYALLSSTDSLITTFSYLSEKYISFLPIDYEQNVIFNMPNPATLQEIEKLSNEYIYNCNDLSCFIYDLSIECQNHLLGRLYKNQVNVRWPIDPNHLAINFQCKSFDEWIKYFENDTGWVKKIKELESQAKEFKSGNVRNK